MRFALHSFVAAAAVVVVAAAVEFVAALTVENSTNRERRSVGRNFDRSYRSEAQRPSPPSTRRLSSNDPGRTRSKIVAAATVVELVEFVAVVVNAVAAVVELAVAAAAVEALTGFAAWLATAAGDAISGQQQHELQRIFQ